ncbi:methyltransferase family protein [Pelolinea submarina]|uniref:Phospholipid methyltransferase n=1 Tax=Pelolinea submarina TaxID=913107 RepID=A0A347ZUJ8_9CHLR|nr:methyltransferase [Pelolinea submarina]REG10434.1 phospholipid methyltransferase [Pelolinea submarina]BBB48979.1 protein-S-isoprenylcysteine O-methyltransferase [Pelolinea submarina]
MQKDLKNDPRYQNHESRPDLAGEHPVGDTWQGIGMLVFIAAAVLDYFLLGNPQRFNQQISFWARLPFSLALFGLGVWLALRGIQVVFGEYREEPVMITEDLFAYMRHPVYLGSILLYLAVLLLVLSPLAGLVWLGILGLYHWLAKYEEGRMLGIFGERYRAYQQHVPMWLPIKFNK